ncbi:MAG: hypothetical protein HY747_06805 [Elusimicrobia bacterium]|nr:hypothetical protein [Elusimicrobiota bacterium]
MKSFLFVFTGAALLFGISGTLQAQDEALKILFDGTGVKKAACNKKPFTGKEEPDAGASPCATPLHSTTPPVHQWLVYQAKFIWSNPEIDSFLPSEWSNDSGSLDSFPILYGTKHEDTETSDVWAGCCPPRQGCRPYCNHFWNADGGPDDGLYACWNGAWDGANCERKHWDSAYRRAQKLWDEEVLPRYNSGDKAAAYYWLGRIAHLLGDISVPAHVHKDVHISDSYEHYMAERNGDVPNDYNFKQWKAGGSGYAPAPGDSLYDLFYDMAEITDDFDSNDSSGDLPEHREGHAGAWETQHGAWGWHDVSYAECRRHGNVLMPEAMKHLAGVYRLFWETTHPDDRAATALGQAPQP